MYIKYRRCVLILKLFGQMPKRLLKPSNYIKLSPLKWRGSAIPLSHEQLRLMGGMAPCLVSPPGGDGAATAGSALGRVVLLAKGLCGSRLHPGQASNLDSLLRIFWSSLGGQMTTLLVTSWGQQTTTTPTKQQLY